MRKSEADSLPAQLADEAEFIVNNLEETVYRYKERIDPAAGIYYCDCNSFVGYILQQLGGAQYAMIQALDDKPRPRAFAYYTFFAGLPVAPTDGWTPISSLADAQRGDILAWELAGYQPGQDTGHVVFVAREPTLMDSGMWSVWVYDSAAYAHFDDTRGDGEFQFASGVGSGYIYFGVDDSGAPTSFQFGPDDPVRTEPIAIGRAESS